MPVMLYFASRSTRHQAGFDGVPIAVCAHMSPTLWSLVFPSTALDADPALYVSGDCQAGLCNAMFGPVSDEHF